jgi:hypothetical protein
MSVIAILRQLTFMASPKSFSLIDLSYLPAEKLPEAHRAASTDFSASSAAQKKFLQQVSLFACHFRLLQ